MLYVPAAFLVLLSIPVALAAPAVTTANVCTQAVYKALLPLATYAAAKSYCDNSFPRTFITTSVTTSTSTVVSITKQTISTFTVTTSTSTSVTTLTVGSNGQPVAARAADPMPIAAVATDVPNVLPRATDPLASLLSSLSAQQKSIAALACSCFVPAKFTTTVTSTAVAPTTSTSTSKTTVYTSTSTAVTVTTSTSTYTLPAPTCAAGQQLVNGYCYLVEGGKTVSGGGTPNSGPGGGSVTGCETLCSSYATCMYIRYISQGDFCILYDSGAYVSDAPSGGYDVITKTGPPG